MAKKDYPKKRLIGFTSEQDAALVKASNIRDKTSAYLVREYVEKGANADIADDVEGKVNEQE